MTYPLRSVSEGLMTESFWAALTFARAHVLRWPYWLSLRDKTHTLTH